MPLEKIALSCSGGGYRAASFHLGAMSYLNRLIYKGKPLLENVKLISTVSGGTITGVVYALKKQEGLSFDEFYKLLIGKLRTLDLVKLSLEKLNPGATWGNMHKRKNLINAFAELYDQAFTNGKTFQIFDVMNSHLEAVVFNSTEFSYAIDFRFRNIGTGIFGNNYLKINHSAAKEVKLSDAIASSSCFPGGFEPMIWPHDFVHGDSPHLEELKNVMAPVGIMDGGIYDNQGIESILNYKKSIADPYFDLVIISDVASPYMNPFVPAEDELKKGFRRFTLKDIRSKAIKINQILNAGLVVLTIGLALLPLLCRYSNTVWTGISLGLSASSLIVLILKTIFLNKVKKSIGTFFDSYLKKIPPFFVEKLKHLKIDELSVRRIEPLIMDRLNSVFALMSTIFLKIIRRQNYYKLYENDPYQYRRVSNLIMEMTERDYLNRAIRSSQNIKIKKDSSNTSILTGSYEEAIGPNIKKIAEEAAGFGTTLWFTDQDQLEDKLDKLISTGQFTLCHNILEYLEELIFDKDNGYDQLDAQTQSELNDLHDKCSKDWVRFKEDPMFLIKAIN